MQIKVERKVKTEKSTIGELSINGKFLCYTLEDKDRGLKQTDSLLSIKARKLFGITAIPSGTYELVNSFSNRFQKYLPELKNVPGYEGVRIHTGNTAEHSHGCLIVGMVKGIDFVGKSRDAFDLLMSKIETVEKTEKIFIEIV